MALHPVDWIRNYSGCGRTTAARTFLIQKCLLNLAGRGEGGDLSNCLRALIGNRCVIHYRRDREPFIPKKPMKVQKVHAVHVHVHKLCKMITSAYPNSMANCKWPTGTVTCSATLTHICICLPNHVPCLIVRNSQLIRIQFVDIEALGAKRKLKKRLQLCDRLKVLHRHAKRSSGPAIQRSDCLLGSAYHRRVPSDINVNR